VGDASASLCTFVRTRAHTHIHARIHKSSFACNMRQTIANERASDGDLAQAFVFLREIGKPVTRRRRKYCFARDVLHLMTVIKNTLFSVALSYEIRDARPRHDLRGACIFVT